MARTAEQIAAETLGAQAIRIVLLTAQLEAQADKIKTLEAEAKGTTPYPQAVNR